MTRSADFRYEPRKGGAIRAALWLAEPDDEAPLRVYASTHAMEVVAVLRDVPRDAVRGILSESGANLILVWRVERLSDHPLLPLLAPLREDGIELMTVLAL